MLRSLIRGMFLLGFLFGTIGAYADEERTYTEGVVIDVTSVRTKPGMFDEYMKFLDGPYKKFNEELKKAGIIVDSSVYIAFPRGPHDPDLYLTTVYKNWAAFDGLRDKMDPIEKKIWGSMEASDKAAIDREKIREILGDQVIQEAKLK
jgi:hypothetical protein